MVPGWNGQGSCQACPDEIFVMRPDGSDQTQLTSDVEKGGGVTGAVEPSWSPDGSRIVFKREFANRGNELVVISVRSRRERVLRAPNGNDPVWGSRGIAYVY
jgi:Tol biopolymer transport system component